MIKYASIGQFRNAIKSIKKYVTYVGRDEDGKPIHNRNAELPKITFKGTVKLHGTNGGICLTKDGLHVQSRNRIITPDNDNMGFATFVESNKESILIVFDVIRNSKILLDGDTITIYGEWCGGKVQKNVAISGLPMMFVIFDIKISSTSDDNLSCWIDEGKILDKKVDPEGDSFRLSYESSNIYNINDFETHEIIIDIKDPKTVRNKLIEFTNNVEKECPVGKKFKRIIGTDNTTGEGIVWKAEFDERVFRFKVKGKDHSSSKVKKLASISPEKIESIKKFVEYAATENRFNQGIEVLFTSTNTEPETKHVGKIMKWVFGDICKEEKDTLKENGLSVKEVRSDIYNSTKKRFFEYLDNLM